MDSPARLRTTRMALFPVALLALCAVPLAFAAPWTPVLLVFPLVLAVWVLRAGVDIATIALWLGHSDIRATQIYLHADLAIKERALLRTTPPNIAPGRYRPPDPLLAFLEAL